MVLLAVNGLSKEEKTGFSVRDIRFTQEQYQHIAIVGETGSGKTSLLKMIAGLQQPDRGEILFEGLRVKGPFEKLLPGHPRIAYLSQHFELRNNYRVEEELEARNKRTDEEARAIYDVCRITHLLKRKTDQLSGGERQRIVLARLLTTSPSLLLLDEPFSNLDRLHTHIIKEVLKELVEKWKISCIMVSHDAEDLLAWSDRVLVMREGRIIQDAAPDVVYEQPADRYTAALLGEFNLIGPALAARLLPGKTIPIPGKNWMIRPEKIIPVPLEMATVTAQVNEVQYCGSHFLVIIEAEGQTLKMWADKKLKPGDHIGISLSPAEPWLV